MLGVVGVKIENAAQAAGLLRKAQRSRSVTMLTAREVVIDADQPQIPVGIDGESVLMPTPVRVPSTPWPCGSACHARGLASPNRDRPWTGPGWATRRSHSPAAGEQTGSRRGLTRTLTGRTAGLLDEGAGGWR